MPKYRAYAISASIVETIILSITSMLVIKIEKNEYFGVFIGILIIYAIPLLIKILIVFCKTIDNKLMAASVVGSMFSSISYLSFLFMKIYHINPMNDEGLDGVVAKTWIVTVLIGLLFYMSLLAVFLWKQLLRFSEFVDRRV